MRRLERRDDLLVRARLAVVVIAVAGAVAIRVSARSWWWMAVPAVLFLSLLPLHELALRSLRRARRATAFHDAGLARIEDRWAGSGDDGRRFADEHHPYAADLDLFGPGSVFELLDRARTTAGEEILAGWLLAPAEPAEIRARQEAITELRPRLGLREEMFLLGEEVRAEVDPDRMSAWAAAPPVLPRGPARFAAPLLSAVSALVVVAWAAGAARGPVVATALAVQGLYALYLRARVGRVVAAADRPARHLEVLALVLGRIERERFGAPLLQRIRARLDTGGVPPSVRIRRLALLVDLLDARRNQLFAPVAALLLWTTHLAFLVESWRLEHGPSIERWLRSVGEVEALLSLSGYAFEHPDDPFPEIVDGARLLEAEDLGHPLVPDARCVRNSVALAGETRLLVVSGSNMSGKSTLLRVVGVNAVLALAGAPVRGRRMRLGALRVAATLRIQDSLREGSSRFYAEITRLRRVVDLTRDGGSVLFLLDELLQGTNSADRAAGAEGVLRGLLDRGAIGLVTTHDLALASIADALAPLARNVHFEDRIEGGRLVFDYRLRPGVVARSNALELMRSVGLDV